MNNKDVGDLKRIANAVEKLDLSGGGSSIKNPKITITVDNISATGVQIDMLVQEIDGNLIPITPDNFISIHHTTETIRGYAVYNETQEAYYCQMSWTSSAFTYTSTLTNCTIVEAGDDIFIIAVTDPTKEASAELVFTKVSTDGR